MAEVDVNGLTYHVQEWGAGPALVLLHGFTGSSRSWSELVATFGEGRRIAAIDLLGHGATDAPYETSRYAFARAVDDLAAIATALDLERASWLGYSMGGRLALGLAVMHPTLVARLVLESASPGFADPDARAERRAADNTLAETIERHGVEAFVDQWERHPLWASQEKIAGSARQRQREIRLANRPQGLAGSLRGMGSGQQPSFWQCLSEVEIPTLLVAGALDAKFYGIARRMAQRLPQGTAAIVPRAGHVVHLEQPNKFSDLVYAFLAPAERQLAWKEG